MDKNEILEILDKLKGAGLFTRSKTHDKVIERYRDEDAEIALVIVTNGIPPGFNHCRECKENLPSDQFSYYQTRVDQRGYLSRSNAVCHSCSKKIGDKRKMILDKEKDAIPEKPRPGSICPNCERAWQGNWHRHHDDVTEKFIKWLCGNCNMALQDQRNKQVR